MEIEPNTSSSFPRQEGTRAFSVVDDEERARALRRRFDWHLLPWAFAIGVVSYLDRTNLAFAAVELNRDLGFTCETYGLGAGLFFVGYAVFQVPSVSVFTRVGVPWLASTIIVWGVVAGSFALVTSKSMFLSLRVLLGALESGTFPCILNYLSRFYAPQALGTAYAAAATSTAFAQVIGSPLAASILLLDGLFHVSGWQWLFLIEGLTSIGFGIVIYAYLPRSASSFLNHEDNTWLHQQKHSSQFHIDGNDGHESRSGRDWRLEITRFVKVFLDWRSHYLGAVFFTIMQAMYGYVFFIPMIIDSFLYSSDGANEDTQTSRNETVSSSCSGGEGGHSSQGNSASVALLSMVPFTVASIAMIVVGKLSEMRNERRYHAFFSVILGAVCMNLLSLTMYLAMPPWVSFVILTLGAASVWSHHGPFITWPSEYFDRNSATLAFAIINSFGSLGGFLGPTVLGFLAQSTGGYGVALAILGCILFLGGVAILFFAPGNPNRSWPNDRDETMTLECRPHNQGPHDGEPEELDRYNETSRLMPESATQSV